MIGKIRRQFQRIIILNGILLFACLFLSTGGTLAADLPEIQQRGVLRHLGVPYANFVTGSGDGLDVELIRLFAQHLGVEYQYVKTTWSSVIEDLTGKKARVTSDKVQILGECPVRGDLIANGMTILKWRKKLVDFSLPTFPTQVWLISIASYIPSISRPPTLRSSWNPVIPVLVPAILKSMSP